MRMLLAFFEDYANARGAVDALLARRICGGEAPSNLPDSLPMGGEPLSNPPARPRVAGQPIRVSVEVRTEQDVARIRTALHHFHPVSMEEGFATPGAQRRARGRRLA